MPTIRRSSAPPGGSDTQIQYNSGGTAFGGDAGLTYDATNDTLSVIGTAAAAQRVIIKAAAAQSANIQEWQISDGTQKARITPAGDFSHPSNGAKSESFGLSATVGVEGTSFGFGANCATSGVSIGQGAGGAGNQGVIIGAGASSGGQASATCLGFSTIGGKTV